MKTKLPIDGFENWLRTGNGKKCMSKHDRANDTYMKNRLWWAYHAGQNDKLLAYVNPIEHIFQQLKGKQYISKDLQKQIEYVLTHKEDYTIHNLNKK